MTLAHSGRPRRWRSNQLEVAGSSSDGTPSSIFPWRGETSPEESALPKSIWAMGGINNRRRTHPFWEHFLFRPLRNNDRCVQPEKTGSKGHFLLFIFLKSEIRHVPKFLAPLALYPSQLSPRRHGQPQLGRSDDPYLFPCHGPNRSGK